MWSTPALLLVGIAAGPYGLNLLTPSVLLLIDPGVAMAVAMLGVFVGLSVDVEDVLLIVVGGLLVAAIREPSPGAMLVLSLALAGVSVTVALAGWLLVGQTTSEGEQHVFVVGALLLLGGAATYLSMSAAFAGLLAGLAWNFAGNVSKVRIVRDLHYFQHPLVVLVLITAGAGAMLSIDAIVLAAIFVAARAVLRPVGKWIARRLSRISVARESISSYISAGLVAIALALDAFRADGRPEWTVTLLGAVVIGTVVSEAITLFIPARIAAR